MFKFNTTHRNKYAEIDQANPLRWRVMFRDKKTLHSQSGLIKCKDFFNDVVAWKRTGVEFDIYGFNNKIKFNRAGLYFVLLHIYDREVFKHNLAVLNERIVQDLNTKISVYNDPRNSTRVIIHIPNALWQTTYHISLVTMMIRLCNYKIKYDTWESFFAPESPLNTAEKAFTRDAKEFTQKHGFVLPENAQKYWYCAPYGWNSAANKPITATIIHNNGCSNWVEALKGME